MRKSKKKLFRRGERQQYQKIISYHRKHVSFHRTTSIQIPFFRLLVICASLAVLTLFWPLIISKFIPFITKFEITKVIPSVTLPSVSIPDFSKLIHFELPQIAIQPVKIPSVSIPMPKLPNVHPEIPVISIDWTPFLAFIQSSIQFLSNGIRTIAAYLNPQPLITFVTELVTLIAQTSTAILQSVLNIATTAVIYLDPRPGMTIIVHTVSTAGAYIFEAIKQVVIFMNPLPVMVKTWEIECFIVIQLYYLLSAFLISLLSAVMTIATAVVYIVIMLINLVISLVSAVLSAIGGLLSMIYNGILHIVGGIHRQFIALGNFLHPYVTFIMNVFTQMMNNTAKAFNALGEFTSSLANDYNNNLQK